MIYESRLIGKGSATLDHTTRSDIFQMIYSYYSNNVQSNTIIEKSFFRSQINKMLNWENLAHKICSIIYNLFESISILCTCEVKF